METGLKPRYVRCVHVRNSSERCFERQQAKITERGVTICWEYGAYWSAVSVTGCWCLSALTNERTIELRYRRGWAVSELIRQPVGPTVRWQTSTPSQLKQPKQVLSEGHWGSPTDRHSSLPAYKKEYCTLTSVTSCYVRSTQPQNIMYRSISFKD